LTFHPIVLQNNGAIYVLGKLVMINNVCKKGLYSKIMLFKVFIFFNALLLSLSVFSQPKTIIKHQRNDQNLAEIQITNQTIDALICYVAIDGHKIYFRLQARESSVWYKATDPRYNYKNFSTWCDYLSLHEKYIPKGI
jgi:hypothetical protein